MILLLVLLVGLSACGKKGPVRPLLRAEPAAPGRPEIRQIGPQIVLLTDLPTANLDGSPLTDLTELMIFRRETADGVCGECDEPTELWRTVDLLIDAPKGGRVVIRDSDVLPGYGYRYRIVPVTARSISGAAVSLARQLQPSPQAPQGLTAKGLDRMVHLEWQEDSPLAPGWESLGCQVIRTSDEALLGLLPPLTITPVKGGSYDDVGPENGTLYRYQIRCLAKKGETIVESPPSLTIEVTPKPE